MADQEQFRTSRREMEQRDKGQKIGERHESQTPQRKPAAKPGGTVGRDVPDESKEHHTEIAVEAGRRGGKGRDKH